MRDKLWMQNVGVLAPFLSFSPNQNAVRCGEIRVIDSYDLAMPLALTLIWLLRQVLVEQGEHVILTAAHTCPCAVSIPVELFTYYYVG